MLAFSNDYYGMIFRATQSVELFCAYDNNTHARQNGSVIFLFASDSTAFTSIYAPAAITNNLSISPEAIFSFLSYCSYLSNTFGDGQSPFFFFSRCPLQNI